LFELNECLILAGQKSFIVLLTKIELKMRKLLFLSIAVAFSATVIAQSTSRVHPRTDVNQMSIMSPDNPVHNQNTIPHVSAKRVQPAQNHTAIVNVIQIGSSSNGLGNFYIGRSLLEYEPMINTATLVHRSNSALSGDANTGFYRYDKSTDGGSTWSVNLGPIWGPTYNSANTVTGRYPVGTIGNPDGNTDPNNAYEVYAGPWHSGSGSPANTWHGTCYGVAQLSGSSVIEHYDSTNDVGNQTWPDDIFVSKHNVLWKMYTMRLDNQGAYQDTVRVVKGTWTGTDYTETFQDLYWDQNPLLGTNSPYDLNVAFSDDGITGYAVGIGNGDDSSNSVYPTGVMYMQMYITHDGGNTWVGQDASTPLGVSVEAPGSSVGSLVGGAWFGNPDSTFTCSGFGLNGNRPDFDMVVDGNGNAHIFVAVLPGANFGETTSNPGEWGLADLYTTDHGSTWYGQLVAKPNTYWGTFNDPTAQVFEGPRPIISRNADGTKLFYGWFDTDPQFQVTTNDFPDLMVTGYDMTANKWSPVVNMTAGTAAEALCTFGLGSYYVKENSCTFTFPAAYMTPVPDVNSPCDYYYIDGANVTCSDFTIDPNPPILLYPTKINEAPIGAGFAVSANYPNPFNGNTTVNVTLSVATDVTIEVTNMVGQMLSSKVYTNLVAGVNKLVIDGASLAKGMYTYKVIAGKNSVTKTMMVR
jgi:hypothetical protein